MLASFCQVLDKTKFSVYCFDENSVIFINVFSLESVPYRLLSPPLHRTPPNHYLTSHTLPSSHIEDPHWEYVVSLTRGPLISVLFLSLRPIASIHIPGIHLVLLLQLSSIQLTLIRRGQFPWDLLLRGVWGPGTIFQKC